MKNSRFFVPLLLVVLGLQSIFIFSAFTPSEEEEEEKKEEVVQSYKIERTYFNGRYFYVLVSGGEAKGFIQE